MITEMNELSNHGHYIFQQDGARAHTAEDTIAYLQSHVPAIIPPYVASKQPRFKPSELWNMGEFIGKIYRDKIRDINHLRDVLVQAWYDFLQNKINTIINQFRKRFYMVKEVEEKHIEQFFLIFSFYVSCVHL